MEYPATKIVHWPTGPTYACDRHALALRNLAALLGTHVTVKESPQGMQCANCVNEAKANEKKNSS